MDTLKDEKLAKNPNTPVKMLEDLINQDDHIINCELCENSNLHTIKVVHSHTKSELEDNVNAAINEGWTIRDIKIVACDIFIEYIAILEMASKE